MYGYHRSSEQSVQGANVSFSIGPGVLSSIGSGLLKVPVPKIISKAVLPFTMSPNKEYKKRVREQCDFPEGWGIQDLAGSTFEISDYDGESTITGAIEVVNGDQRTELVLSHREMPGRMEAIRLNRDEDLPEIDTSIPSTIGVLQFFDGDSEAAIEAIDKLASPDALSALAKERDFVNNDSQPSVIEALEAAMDVDTSIVDDSLSSL